MAADFVIHSMNYHAPRIHSLVRARSRSRLALLGLALSFGLAACGVSDSTTETGSPTQETTVTEPNGLPTIPTADPPEVVAFPDMQGTLIGTANMGGEIVDPKPALIDDYVVMESYPEQIGIEFTAGAEGCTAATAQAFATADQVTIALNVGITTDALARTCPAGEFPHRLNIVLEEGLDGRELVLAER